jgi:hypothetical protein
VGKLVMRKHASFALGVLVAVCVCVGLAPAAQADPGPAFTLTVDRHVIHSGERFTATATATTGCDWVLEWNGDRRVEDARTSVATYLAPQVSRPTRIALHVTCFYVPSRGQRSEGRGRSTAFTAEGPSQLVTVTVPPSWRRSLVITVLPPGSAVSPPGAGGGFGHPGGSLANTGGPALWALIAGLGAVLVGSAAVRTSPRRLST